MSRGDAGIVAQACAGSLRGTHPKTEAITGGSPFQPVDYLVGPGCGPIIRPVGLGRWLVKDVLRAKKKPETGSGFCEIFEGEN